MKKYLVVLLVIALLATLLSGCGCKHEWEDATCKDPKTCEKCGETKGDSSDHNWKKATCEKPKTCKTCKKTSGQALGHDWQNGVCTRCKEQSPAVIIMPDLQNMTKEAALNNLATLGLSAENIEIKEENNENFKLGTVIRTTPTKDSALTKDTKITLVVSLGKKIQFGAMPNVVGETKEKAEATLNNQGLDLQIAIEEVYDSSVAAGLVLETIPGRGEKLQTNDVVTLKVSQGVEMKKMPAVLGLNVTEAKAKLAEQGFTRIPVVKYIAGREAKDTVISQLPAADAADKEYEVDVEIILEVSDGTLAPQMIKKTVRIDLKGYALSKRCMVSVKRDGVELLVLSVPKGTTSVELPDQEGLGTVYYTVLIDDAEGWVHTEEFAE